MSTEIKVPTLGESVSEATIGQWFKKVGDAVSVDEALVELETDKVAVEVPSPVSGVLEKIVAAEGDNVEVDALIAIVAEGAGAKGATPAASPAPGAEEKPAAAAAEAPASKSSSGEVPASPAAQKLMNEQNISPDQVTGSGKHGQVLKEDVMAAVAKTQAPTKAASAKAPVSRAPSPEADAPREERVRMTRLRQTIASRLKDAQNTAAMLTTFNEVDMGPVMDLRKNYKELFEK
ncbi:MAG TPA: dihydrolipoamide succinyltransferase, partial [Devosia sp.]|nr:dihydrolipoamide succinyltransferase [Devosia sp.]